MKMNCYIFSALALFVFAGCANKDDILNIAEEECVYSFTAVLGAPESRISYHEDGNEKPNLKMLWDEGDVIRLYPDNSWNGDKEEFYEFVANTGKGTQRTVFVHRGYIPNWEHWSGRAIYVFPNGDNLKVEDDSEDFKTKFQTQTSNNNLDHIKYAEHVLGENGSKQYLEYWSDYLVDYNLKHDHEMYFNHPHTVVYKIMLRGFIYDIPGGSVLKMSGDAWPGGEVTTLTLGSVDDEKPFLKVGEFGRDGYDDKAILTAYIIRQVAGETDGEIVAGGNLRFELLAYDKDDGTVYPLNQADKQTHRNKTDANGKNNYFTNQPWGDEYTWEIKASKDIKYNAGDYVVADLTDLTNEAAYPRIAIDLGLPKKWAAYNVGAKKIDDYGLLYRWGYTDSHSVSNDKLDLGTEEIPEADIWIPGDTLHDAATHTWGLEWVTPTEYDMLDLVYYCRIINSEGSEMNLSEHDDHSLYQWKDLTGDDVYLWSWSSKDTCFLTSDNIKLFRWKSTLNDRYFYWPMAGARTHNGYQKLGSSGLFYTCSWYENLTGYKGPETFSISDKPNNNTKTNHKCAHSCVERSQYKAISIRAVKRHLNNTNNTDSEKGDTESKIEQQ